MKDSEKQILKWCIILQNISVYKAFLFLPKIKCEVINRPSTQNYKLIKTYQGFRMSFWRLVHSNV